MDSTALELEVARASPDAVTVDALARLQLAARREGAQLKLRGCLPELAALIGLCGLGDVLPHADG